VAIEQWQQTLALDPEVRHYAERLAGYLVEQRRPREALAVIAKGMELQPALHNDTVLLALQAKARQALDETTSTH
jgi:hypothetical protein